MWVRPPLRGPRAPPRPNVRRCEEISCEGYPQARHDVGWCICVLVFHREAIAVVGVIHRPDMVSGGVVSLRVGVGCCGGVAVFVMPLDISLFIR